MADNNDKNTITYEIFLSDINRKKPFIDFRFLNKHFYLLLGVKKSSDTPFHG